MTWSVKSRHLPPVRSDWWLAAQVIYSSRRNQHCVAPCMRQRVDRPVRIMTGPSGPACRDLAVTHFRAIQIPDRPEALVRLRVVSATTITAHRCGFRGAVHTITVTPQLYQSARGAWGWSLSGARTVLSGSSKIIRHADGDDFPLCGFHPADEDACIDNHFSFLDLTNSSAQFLSRGQAVLASDK